MDPGIFDSQYFNSTTKFGYAYYIDGLNNWLAVDHILDLKPTSVLELGCAFGYLIRHINGMGIPAVGMDVSRYAYLNRVTDKVQQFDITQTPWPIKDKAVDLCFSREVLECIDPTKLPDVVREIHRVSKRGLHIIDLQCVSPNLENLRHPACTKEWWDKILVGPTTQEVRPISLDPSEIRSLIYNTGPIKINFGSWINMFNHGWYNVDWIDLKNFAVGHGFRFMKADVTREIKHEPHSTTAIVCSHILDHLPKGGAETLLGLSWQMLMAGGVIRVAVPDFEKLTRMYKNGELGYFDALNDDIAKADQAGKLYALLAGRSNLYDLDRLSKLMHSIGFTKIQRVGLDESRSKHMAIETYDTLPDMSLCVEASKFVI